MEIRQLEYLVTVVEEGSFTRAAERLHVAQPAVSASVRKLERELGLDLIDRRAVTPTSAGRDVVDSARQALVAVGRVTEVADDLRGLLTGAVSIGVIASGLPSQLPDLLASFARDHPGVELRLSEGPGHDLLAEVTAGRHDLAVVGTVGELPASVEALTLSEERVVAAVGADDPLAARRQVRLAELAGRRLIVQPPGTGMRYGIDAALREQQTRVDIAYEAATPMLLGELAVRGLGVALVPSSVVPFVDGLRGIAVVRPSLRARVQLVWAAGGPSGPAARAFLAHLARSLRPRAMAAAGILRA